MKIYTLTMSSRTCLFWVIHSSWNHFTFRRCSGYRGLYIVREGVDTINVGVDLRTTMSDEKEKKLCGKEGSRIQGEGDMNGR